jgi:hypothetical protein
MSYQVLKLNDVEVEEYITARIVRLKSPEGMFKFYAQSDGVDGVTVYLGHGNLSTKTKISIRAWAKARGIKHIFWGRGKDAQTTLTV